MKSGTVERLKQVVLQELQEGARGAQTIATRFNMEHRKDAVINGNEDQKLDAEDVATVLDGMVADGVLDRLSDPDGWYQLNGWDERPLRVLRVSHHITKLDGVDQLSELWLDESLRAARFEHEIEEPSLQGLPTDDDRCGYLICTEHYAVIEQYRETLLRLSRETQQSNAEKAMVYRRLAEATDIKDQFDTREREVGLHA